MFQWFEKALQPTVLPDNPEPPADAGRLLLAFRAPGERAVRRAVRDRLRRRAARYHDPGVHRPRRDPRHHEPTPDDACSRNPGTCCSGWRWCCWCAAAGAHGAEHGRQPGDRRQRHQPDPLAGHWHVVRQSWAFFQNDFAGRIANKRDADRACDPPEPGLDDHGGLVHPGLRHQRDAAAGRGRSLAGAADPGLVRRLRDPAAHLRAAHARHARSRCRKRARS